MEKVAYLAHRWRYGVVVAELVLAAGCLYFGWRAVAPEAAAARTVLVHHSAPAAADAFGAGALRAFALPTARAGSLHSKATPRRALQASNLSADWLSRMNADDYDLYRGQWQTLQLLMSGVRQYLEQRVVPRLLGH